MARKPPPCDEHGCGQAGDHFCKPRARRVVSVFEQLLCHTKGQWARRPFKLTSWQRRDLIEPLFGRVEYSWEARRYVRQLRLLWMEVARKNGKSELLAGIALILLVADDEEGAEIYSCALDREQARVVYDVAERMVELSPLLSQRLRIYRQSKRIVYPRLGSWYQVVAADAAGNLGRNPHGIIFDEVLTQPSAELWTAMRSAMGARVQPLMVAATTAGNNPLSFCAAEHDYSARVLREPELDPRRLVYMRNTPTDADPWDERKWSYANPALGDFLSLESVRDDAREARNDPAKENAFRQYRLNQWVSQVTRWLPLSAWDACEREQLSFFELRMRARRRRCFGGLDLSSKFDLTALCWLFPELGNLALWRFWLPEEQVEPLDQATGGQLRVWIKDGWLEVTSGSTIDYERIYDALDEDRETYRVQDLNYDAHMAGAMLSELEHRGLTSVQVSQGYALSEALTELMRLVKARELWHGGNPVARWNAESAEIRVDARERIQLVRPSRAQSAGRAKRVDGIAALADAVDGWMRRGKQRRYQAAGF